MRTPLKSRMAKLGYPIVTVIGLVVLWQLLVVVFGIPSYILPLPSDVILFMVGRWQYMSYHTWITLQETLIGFILSIAIGLPIAAIIVEYKAIDRAVMPLLILSQTFPKIALAPLLLLWLGFGMALKVSVSFLVAFFPIVISSVTGMRSVETTMMELIRSLRARRLEIFFKIRLPSALPNIFSGLKVAIAFALVGSVVGEWVGADRGLGYLLIWANANLDTNIMFSVLIILAVVGATLYYSVAAIERLMLPWHVSVREEVVDKYSM